MLKQDDGLWFRCIQRVAIEFQKDRPDGQGNLFVAVNKPTASGVPPARLLPTPSVVMADAGLTRGAFYSHFSDKSALYAEAITYAALQSQLAKYKPPATGEGSLQALLEGDGNQ